MELLCTDIEELHGPCYDCLQSNHDLMRFAYFYNIYVIITVCEYHDCVLLKVVFYIIYLNYIWGYSNLK